MSPEFVCLTGQEQCLDAAGALPFLRYAAGCSLSPHAGRGRDQAEPLGKLASQERPTSRRPCFFSTFGRDPAKRAARVQPAYPMEQSLPRPAACRAPLRRPFWFGAAILLGLAVAAPDRPAVAAPANETAAAPRAVILPGFWDPRRRPERPDLTRIQTIRFLTDVDYPPFNYIGPDGNPAGFNVDLARLICDEIKISCTIQARSFNTSARCAQRQSRRRRDRLDRADRGHPPPRRFHRSLLPHAGAFRGAARFADRRRAAGAARRQEDRGRCRHRARGLPQGHVHRGAGARLSQRRGGARGAAQQGRRLSVRRRHRARFLAQRRGLRPAAAASAAGRFWKAASSAKASASR